MSLNITSIGTPDLCARDVACDVGPTKGEEVEGGLALYITFNFGSRNHLVEPFRVSCFLRDVGTF